MSSPGSTFDLTCGKGVTELQNLTNLRLSSFAESYQMQQKNFDVSPNDKPIYLCVITTVFPRATGVDGEDIVAPLSPPGVEGLGRAHAA